MKAHAGKMAEKVNWFGYMPVFLMRLKWVKAWNGLLEWESWVMREVQVNTLFGAWRVVVLVEREPLMGAEENWWGFGTGFP